MNIKLTLEYDGTDFEGWQLQPRGRTLQGTIEEALATMLGEPVRLHASGRTDSGVHALAQVANFKTSKVLPIRAYEKGLSSILPRDVAVVRAEVVDDDFEARRAARGKFYRYTILNRPCRSPLSQRFVWELFKPLDVAAMREAARCLLGAHDFSAFRASDCEAKVSIRALRRFDLLQNGDRLDFEVVGSGFLKHMVRNIVGTLVEVGLGRRSIGSVEETLVSRDRHKAGPTAPPQGLCLVEVLYDPSAGPTSHERNLHQASLITA